MKISKFLIVISLIFILAVVIVYNKNVKSKKQSTPTMITNTDLEAKKWLANNKNKYSLASNRFLSTQDALKFVEKLYSLGAVRVEINPKGIFDEEWRTKQEGGPYADSLLVYLPQDSQIRKALFDLLNEEIQGQGIDEKVIDQGEEHILFWWD